LDVHDRSPRPRQQRGQPSVHADGSRHGPSETTGAAIAFYVSGHGFGHASRQVEIINAVATRLPGVRIVRRTSAARWLLERTLNPPFTLDDRPCDTGVVQIDSLRLDEAATMAAAADFYSSFDERIAIEARLLRQHGVWLVLSDAPPLACAAAAAAGIPCIVVANFTWDWIYAPYASPGSDPTSMQDRHTSGSELKGRETSSTLANVTYDVTSALMSPERTAAGSDPRSVQNRHTSGSELVRRLADAYALAEAAWRLPLHGGFESLATIVDVPFVARHARCDATETRARLALPAHGRIALSSFGGYGLDGLELHRLDCLDTWSVVVTGDRAPSDLPSNVIFIEDAAIYERGLRYEDLVRAVDVVATKPGYGIVSECIANGTAIAYTTRGRFREYDALVAGIRRYLRSAFIDQNELRAGRWRAALDAALAAPRPLERPPTDGAEAVADMIAARLGGSDMRGFRREPEDREP
jgi:L-arabinokinase